MSRRRQIILVLLALTFVRGLIYTAVVPPWQAPDEPRHFEYVRLIYEKGRDISGADLSESVQQDIIGSMDRFDYWGLGHLINPRFDPGTLPTSFEDIWFPGRYDPDRPNLAHQVHQPPLYYLLEGFFLRAIGVRDVTTQLYIGRLISVIFAVCVVLVAYLSAYTLFPLSDDLQVAVPAVVAFLPMHTFVTSAVMNDVLAELLVSILIYLLTVLLIKGLTVSRVGLILATLILGQFTKRTFLIAFPITLCAIVLAGMPYYKRVIWMKVGQVTAIIVPILVGLAWWRWATLAALFEHWRNVSGIDVQLGDLTNELLAHPERYFWAPFKSFWGWFGWMKIELDLIWYLMFALCCLVATLGLLRVLWRGFQGQADLGREQWGVLILYFCAIGLIGLANIANAVWGNVNTIWVIFLPQGRYMFPVIIPISVLMLLGLREWIPNTHRYAWLVGLLAFLVLFDAIALVAYMIPYFYG